MTAPNNQSPEGAYVSGGSGQSSITDLNGLDESTAKARMQAPLQGTFAGMHGGFWGVVNGILGLLGGAVNLVVGAVQIFVDGIKGVIDAIGSLFGAAHVDTAAVDAARVAGENAIVANWGDTLEQLDEIQRVGGAFGNYEMFNLTWGEDNPHPIPVTEPFGLMQGVKWHPYNLPWTYGHGHTFPDNETSRGTLARTSGCLELLEPGLWMIYFQASLLQGNQRTSTPADLWCYVSSSANRHPVGTPPAPGGMMKMYSRQFGTASDWPSSGIAAYGRAGQYLGVQDTRYGGGNTVSGYMLAPLDSAGWFVHLAGTGYRHFGGAASTMVFATKVNSETLRDDIEELKDQIADALPGQPTDMLLSDASIATMVAEAQALEVEQVEVPTEYPKDGNG